MLWLKAFHIIFVISWYAGLLYLPRLFVYHADCHDAPGDERFQIMERKLFAIMTVGAIGSLIFGLWLLHAYAWAAYSFSVWLWIKLALVGGLLAFHVWCWHFIKQFRDRKNTHTHRFYRMINEIPALILIAVVIAVVVKPV
jgi:protoporphyrinogen IX oxidase